MPRGSQAPGPRLKRTSPRSPDQRRRASTPSNGGSSAGGGSGRVDAERAFFARWCVYVAIVTTIVSDCWHWLIDAIWSYFTAKQPVTASKLVVSLKVVSVVGVCCVPSPGASIRRVNNCKVRARIGKVSVRSPWRSG
jgi:hypothetical protein